jgi:adenylate kinase
MYISTYRVSGIKTFINKAGRGGVLFCIVVGMWKQVLFLGAPGVGKGTYARRVAPRLGFGHVSPGELLRKSLVTRPDLMEYLQQGKLVPESTVFDLVDNELKRLKSTKGVILDGFPRSKQQAEKWMGSGGRVHGSPDLVVEFHLPRDLLVQKLLGRRTCASCGDLYNVFSFKEGEYSMPAMLPKQEGVCDTCGGQLIQRIDDTVETIHDRLRDHYEREQSLIELLQTHCNQVVRFDVKTGIAQVDELVSLIHHRLV